MDGPSVVYMHVGPPKTGSTYLQDVLWRNRAVLAERGFYLPGNKPTDQFQAGFALRGQPTHGVTQGSDDRDPWDLLADQVRSANGSRAAVISDERLAACTEREVARAVESLQPAEVRVLYCVRAPVEVVISEWQQSVKGGNKQTFGEFLHMVQTRRDPSPVWYWRVHDVREVIRRWTSVIGPDRLFVVTMPPPGSDKQLLWRRFTSVLGIDPDGFDLDVRSNPSLGREGVELMRQVNVAMPHDYPRRQRLSINRDTLGDRILAHRSGKEKIRPPRRAIEWADTYTEELTATLAATPCPVVGEVDDIRRENLTPGDDSVEPALDVPAVAMDALLGLLQEWGRRRDRMRQAMARTVKERDAARAARDRLQHEGDALRHDLQRARRSNAALRKRAADLERRLALQEGLRTRARRRLVDLAGRRRPVGWMLACWRWGRRFVRQSANATSAVERS